MAERLNLEAGKLACGQCAEPAAWHVEIARGGLRVFACDEHQRVRRWDDHPLGDGCADGAATTWLPDGCFSLAAKETALAAAIESLADDEAVRGIGRLDPDNEYYGMSGIWVEDGVTLARLLSKLSDGVS